MTTSFRPLLIRIARRITGIRVKNHARFRAVTDQKAGLEIGGPSGAFRDAGILPLYKDVGSLDNCVFSTTTTWEGTRTEGRTFQFHPKKPLGFNYIREATGLTGIGDRSYDFVLSAHNLEHVGLPA